MTTDAPEELSAPCPTCGELTTNGGDGPCYCDPLRDALEAEHAPAAVDLETLTHSDGPDGRPLCNATDVLYVTKQRETVTCPACAHALGAASRQEEVDALRKERDDEKRNALRVHDEAVKMIGEIERLTVERDALRSSIASRDDTIARLDGLLSKPGFDFLAATDEARAAGAASRDGEVAALWAGEAEALAAALRYRSEHDEAEGTNARLTRELAAARDCGQAEVCALPPGCARHWEERNRELAAELASARADGAREEREAIVPLLIQLADAIRARGQAT